MVTKKILPIEDTQKKIKESKHVHRKKINEIQGKAAREKKEQNSYKAGRKE